MPGQRKRKDRERERARRFAARTAPGTGHWEVFFETQDYVEYRDYVRGLERRIDPELVRLDTFCGREIVPTTYRVSVFVRSGLGT